MSEHKHGDSIDKNKLLAVLNHDIQKVTCHIENKDYKNNSEYTDLQTRKNCLINAKNWVEQQEAVIRNNYNKEAWNTRADDAYSDDGK